MFILLGQMPGVAEQPENAGADVHWHDYRKTARAGRKIGHVTVTAESDAGLRAKAAQLAGHLGVAAEINFENVLLGLNKTRG